MLPEKHNDPHSWKNKLVGLTGLPGEAALEKNIAWEKLHSRLCEKPKRKKAVWYWAAACLCCALMIPLMLPDKKENVVVWETPPHKEQTSALTVTPEVPVTVKVLPRVEMKKMESSSIKDKKHTTINKSIIKEEPVTAIVEPVIEKDPVAIITDTATIVVAIPVKKKLAVVHINELETPSAQFYPLPNYVQKSFKIKFKNGKAANQTIASQQQYEGGFKIKLSTKN